MDADLTDGGFEVRELIERLFLPAPVVFRVPIAHESFEVIGIGARVPSGALNLMGPSGIFQALLQVAQYLIGHMDGEFCDLVFFHGNLATLA